MHCPFCRYPDTKVIDSRASNAGRAIRRRRQCLSCHRRFTTKEHAEESPLLVIKADGRREPYDHQKIKRSIQIACKKRPVSVKTIDEMVARIEGRLRDKQQDEINSREIGEMVINELRELDEVAYVRFASVYRNFQDKEEFMNELKGLKGVS